jgi:hypothetical protein
MRLRNMGLAVLTVVAAPYVVAFFWPHLGIGLFALTVLGMAWLALEWQRKKSAPPLAAALALVWCVVLLPIGFTARFKEERIAEEKVRLEEQERAVKLERRATIARDNEERADELARLRRGHGAILCMDSSYAPARCSCHDMHGCCANNGGVARCEQD